MVKTIRLYVDFFNLSLKKNLPTPGGEALIEAGESLHVNP